MRPGKRLPVTGMSFGGEHPEPGTRAQTYKFDSPERATGFERGAEDMVGWTACRFVTTAEFLPFEDLASALVDPRLSDATRTSLAAYIEEQGIDPIESGVVYVRPSDGAYVEPEWDPRAAIFNAPAPTRARQAHPSQAINIFSPSQRKRSPKAPFSCTGGWFYRTTSLPFIRVECPGKLQKKV